MSSSVQSDFASVVRHHAQARPDATALRFRDRVTTYRQLDRQSNQVAAALRAEGVGHGDRIGYLGKSSDRYIEILIGAAKIGAIQVGLNWRLAPPEVEYILTDSDVHILFIGEEFLPVVEKVRAALPNLKQ